MMVQEASIYFNKRADFLYLSVSRDRQRHSCRTQIFGITKENQLAAISVGLEGCRASSSRGHSGLLCWFCSLGPCNGLLIGNVFVHMQRFTAVGC